MLPSLRKFRKELIQPSDPVRRYIRYSLGEIILVVIGILLALQINAWNQDRLDRRKERHHLSQLIEELAAQDSLLIQHDEFETGIAESASKLLSQFYKEKAFIPSDSMFMNMNALIIRGTFHVRNTIFRELSSTGDIELIRNEPLRHRIGAHYQNMDRLQSNVLFNNTNLVDGVIIPELLDATIFSVDHLVPATKDRMKLTDQNFGSHGDMAVRYLAEEAFRRNERWLGLHNRIMQRWIIAHYHAMSFRDAREDVRTLSSLITRELEK